MISLLSSACMWAQPSSFSKIEVQFALSFLTTSLEGAPSFFSSNSRNPVRIVRTLEGITILDSNVIEGFAEW